MLRRIIKFLNEESGVYFKNTGKKPLGRQIKELIALKRYYSYIPYHYIKHGLYLKSCEEDIFDYIPPQIVARYRDRINPPHACDYVVDKKLFAKTMAQNNLPVVKNLFTVNRSGSIRDRDEREVGFDGFKKQLVKSPRTRFVIKLFNGGGGKGIYSLSVHDSCLEIDGKKIVNAELLYEILFSGSRFDEFIVQPQISQHELLTRINPSSVNTIRIDTLIQDGDVVNNAAVLRMSDGHAYTDNWTRGGIMVNIDLGTGVLGNLGKMKAKYGGLSVAQHPVSGFRFAGTSIPFWSEVKDLVRAAALALRPLRFLGWDVAIGTDGPILIEANHDFDVFLSQQAAKGLRNTPVGREMLRTVGRRG